MSIPRCPVRRGVGHHFDGKGSTMGVIHIDLFTTLDGVAQAPGGPDEDTEGGFAFGGWQAPVADEVIGEQVVAGIASARRAAARQEDLRHLRRATGRTRRTTIAEVFNRVPKYVASRGNPTLDWDGSTLLGPDIAQAVREVRDRHENVHVIGSLDFVQTLLAERLFDELTLWVFPIVLGRGKKVFCRRHRAGQPHPHRAGGHLAEGHGDVALRALPTGSPARETWRMWSRELLEELARRVVGEHLPAGLARRAVVHGVRRVLDLADGVAAHRARLARAVVHRARTVG